MKYLALVPLGVIVLTGVILIIRAIAEEYYVSEKAARLGAFHPLHGQPVNVMKDFISSLLLIVVAVGVVLLAMWGLS